MPHNNAENKEKLKGISLRVLVVLALSAIFILVLYFITDNIVLDNNTAFDNSVFKYLDRFRSPATTSFFTFFTFFGSINFLMPAYILLSLYFIFFKKNNILSFNIAAVGLSSGLLLQVIKNIFQRHRPPHPLIANVNGFSFPSGHSFSFFTFAGVLIYILFTSDVSKKWKYSGTVILLILANIIALSRVYLEVHYASDVIAGFCLSFIWLSLCFYVLRRISRKGEITKDIAAN